MIGEYILPNIKNAKLFTGKYQVKLFEELDDDNYPYWLLGSATLFLYEDKHYLITNKHVVSKANNINKIVFLENVSRKAVRNIRLNYIQNNYLEQEFDIAILEINESYIPYVTKSLITLDFIELNYEEYVKTISTVILHAIPSKNANIHYSEKKYRFNNTTVYYQNFEIFR